MTGMHQTFDLGRLFNPTSNIGSASSESAPASSADAADKAVNEGQQMLEAMKAMARQMRAGENRLAVGCYVRAMENFSKSMEMAGEMLRESFLDADDESIQPEQNLDIASMLHAASGQTAEG